jgi:hypothetical protein
MRSETFFELDWVAECLVGTKMAEFNPATARFASPRKADAIAIVVLYAVCVSLYNNSFYLFM